MSTPVTEAPVVMDEPTIAPHNWTNGGTKVLILRRCNPDGTSYDGFKWPLEVGAKVSPQKWSPICTCGNGLHGWPWGMGLGEGSAFSVVNDIFIVFSADPADVVGDIDGTYKCKVREAEIVCVGSFGKCWDIINTGRDRLIDAMASPKIADGNRAASSL